MCWMLLLLQKEIRLEEKSVIIIIGKKIYDGWQNHELALYQWNILFDKNIYKQLYCINQDWPVQLNKKEVKDRTPTQKTCCAQAMRKKVRMPGQFRIQRELLHHKFFQIFTVILLQLFYILQKKIVQTNIEEKTTN